MKKKIPVLNKPKYFEYKFCGLKATIAYFNICKDPFYIYETEDYADIICYDTRYFFPKSELYIKGGWLIRIVKKDFAEYLEKHGDVKEIEEYAAMVTNKSSNKKESIVSYDISHAYWRAAYLLGYIKENTYNTGIRNSKFKQMYCIALSVQGTDKVYYKNGDENKTEYIVPGNDYFKIMYNNIRYFIFKIMDELRILLKDDFRGYNIDCIKFIDKISNRILVEQFLYDKKMIFKIQ